MCISFGLIFCTKNEILSTKAACPFSKRRRRVMKTKTRHRVLAFVMAALMVVGIMPFSMLTGIFSSKAQAKTVTASIDISKGLEAGKVYGDDSIVKLEVLADMPVKEGSGATVEGVKYDAFIQQPKANPKPNNGAVPTEGAAFKMTAVTDSKITFVTKAASGKKMYFVEASASEQTISEDATEGSHTYSMTAGKTYYFYVSGSKACVYAISLEKGTPDLDWSKVESPVLETPVVDGSKVSVGWNAPLGDDGGEQLVVNMYSGEKVVDSKIIKGSNSKGTAEFNPTATGDYTFKAVLSRSGEKDKESNEVKAEGFVLPLAAPSNLFATSKGNGKMLIEWDAVPEADSYEVSYSTDGTTYSEAVTATDTKQLLSRSST